MSAPRKIWGWGLDSRVECLARQMSAQENEIWEEALDSDRARWRREAIAKIAQEG